VCRNARDNVDLIFQTPNETVWGAFRPPYESGGIIVQHYRIYGLNANDRIVTADNFHCASDQEALAEAKAFLEHYPAVEVWAGTRRVALLGTLPSGARAS
jgi:hypothetical protein